MDFGEIGSTIFSIVGSLFLVCLAVLLGWYFVWKFFLSRFRLVRELLGQISDDSPSPSSSKSGDYRGTKVKKVRLD